MRIVTLADARTLRMALRQAIAAFAIVRHS